MPRALGGKRTCANVCDDCNLYFGSHHNQSPPIEEVIKETFNISRARFLDSQNQIGKNKAMPKFSSNYFSVDFKKKLFTLKMGYRHHKHFQEKISRQLKRGLYKIFLEETESQKQNGHLDKYDFIREFCRYDLGDYPLIYFERTHGIILMSTEWAIAPEMFLEEKMQFKYLVQEPCFFEFEFLGHVFGIATSRHWELGLDNYVRKTIEAKKNIFKSFRFVKNFSDIDLALSIIND